MNDKWDVLVVGGGPGGVSAALWAHRLGLRTLMIEASDAPGGQVATLSGNVIDYPGFSETQGPALAKLFARHLEVLEIPTRFNTPARTLQLAMEDSEDQDPALVLESGELLSASAIVLATGAARRSLNVPGEAHLRGRGVSDSPLREREAARGTRVIIVGGGDGAFENALLLAPECPQITIVCRSEARARPYFQEQAARLPNIKVLEHTTVVEICGSDRVTGLRLERNGEELELEAEWVFIKIGVSPQSHWLREAVTLNADGYVAVDPQLRTSARRIYAVGDLCNPVYSSIAKAVGDGMVAARTLLSDLGR